MLFRISILGIILLAGYCSGLCGGCGPHKVVSTQDPGSGSSTVTQDPESCSSTITDDLRSGSSTVTQGPGSGGSTVTADPGTGSSTITQDPGSGSSTVTQNPGSGSSTVTQDPGSGSSTVTTESSTSTTLSAATAFCREQGTLGGVYPAPYDVTCKKYWMCVMDSNDLRGVEVSCSGARYFNAALKRCGIEIPADCLKTTIP